MAIADHTGNKLHRLTEQDSRLTHYFALFWIRCSSAKSDIKFLLSDPDFL